MTLISELPWDCWLSVAVRVILWGPALRVAFMDPPVPNCPSISEVHTRDAPVREPSSSSLAEPVKEMLSVVSNKWPVDGLVMTTVGALLGGEGLSVRTFSRMLFAVSPLDQFINPDSEVPSGVTTSTARKSPSDSFNGLSLTLKNTVLLNLPPSDVVPVANVAESAGSVIRYRGG